MRRIIPLSFTPSFNWLRHLLAGLVLLLCSQFTSAVELPNSERSLNLTPYVHYLIDPSNKLDHSQIAQLPHNDWVAAAPDAAAGINFGFTNATIWLKVDLNKTVGSPAEWILEIPYNGLDRADLYTPEGKLIVNGSDITADSRPYHSRFYAFPIVLGDAPQTFYLKVQSTFPITLPLRVTERIEYNRSQFTDNLLQFIYYGGLLSLLFYNLVLYLIIRDKKYLIYSLFTAFTGLGIFAGNGYAQLYLWPYLPEWNEISQTTLLSIGASFALMFTGRFLKTRDRLPITHRLMTGLSYVYFVLAGLLIATQWVPMPRPILYQIMFLVSLVAPAVALYASIRVANAGHNSAIYFLLSWGIFCLGTLVAALRLLEFMPSNSFTLYALQISSGIEMLLFSFALAYRFQFERLQREQAQSAVLAAKEEVIQTVRASEERLERAVDERTLKLQKLVLSEQHMREQYVRFGAMIAHEFRNPLNIISAQTSILEMEDAPSAEKINKRTGVIRSAVSRLVLLFDQWLESDRLNMAVNEINATRIAIAPWLEELVETCRSYHAEHEITLDRHLPQIYIEADDHLLQIALLNLIDNACKYSPAGSVIEIRTETEQNSIGICIMDSGCGIPEDQLDAVFEPYARGEHAQSTIKGVGLGLAFVNRIVQLHNGRIVIDSTPGMGTSITLWLPILSTNSQA